MNEHLTPLCTAKKIGLSLFSRFDYFLYSPIITFGDIYKIAKWNRYPFSNAE